MLSISAVSAAALFPEPGTADALVRRQNRFCRVISPSLASRICLEELFIL
jgi:hypothetical protein